MTIICERRLLERTESIKIWSEKKIQVWKRLRRKLTQKLFRRAKVNSFQIFSQIYKMLPNNIENQVLLKSKFVLKFSLKRSYGFEFDNNLYSTEFNSPKKSLILSSGLNVSKDEVVSPKQKILYWKPDKFKNLK